MPKIQVEEQVDFPTLPDDSIVHVKLESSETREVQGNRGPWTKIEFKFKILQVLAVQAPGDHPNNYANLVGQYIYGSCPFRLTDGEENKLRLWSEALLNRPLGIGFELDTDYLTGNECRAVTSTYDKRNINPKTGQPFKAHQVASLLPLGQPGAPQPQGQPQQAQPQQQAPGWGAQPQGQPAQDPWSGQPQQAQAQPQAQPQQAQQPLDPWAAPQGSDEPPF